MHTTATTLTAKEAPAMDSKTLLFTYGEGFGYVESKLRGLIGEALAGNGTATETLRAWHAAAEANAVERVRKNEADRAWRSDQERKRRDRVDAALDSFTSVTTIERCSVGGVGGSGRFGMTGMHHCTKTAKWSKDGKLFCSSHRNSIAGVNRKY